METRFSKFIKTHILQFIKKPTLLVLVGLAGSGKSTWIRENKHKWKNTVVVEPDDIRREVFGNVSDMSEPNKILGITRDIILKNLKEKRNVVLDATNLYTSSRNYFINKLREEIDFDLQAKIFNVDPNVAKERIKKDLESGIDRANVPDEVIDSMYQAFQHTIKVLESEGFKIIDEYVEK